MRWFVVVLLLGLPVVGQSSTVRVGQHEGYGRIVFDWPKPVASIAGLQSFVASHVVRTLCSGLTTSTRISTSLRCGAKCIFACSEAATDSLSHYLVCPILWKALHLVCLPHGLSADSPWSHL